MLLGISLKNKAGPSFNFKSWYTSLQIHISYSLGKVETGNQIKSPLESSGKIEMRSLIIGTCQAHQDTACFMLYFYCLYYIYENIKDIIWVLIIQNNLREKTKILKLL